MTKNTPLDLMKARHLENKSDRELMNLLRKRVHKEITVNTHAIKNSLIWKAFIYGIVIIFLYSNFFWLANPLLFLFNYVFYGLILMLIIFNFAHDFSHNVIFKQRKYNHFFFNLIFIMSGAHGASWRDRHLNAHHHAPNVKGFDPDLAISKLIRVHPKSDYLWYHRFQHFYAPILYTTYSIYWIFIKDPVLLFSELKKGKKSKSYYLNFFLEKSCYVGYLILAPLFFGKQTLTLVLLGFLMMHAIQSLFLLFTFFITHHVEKTQYPEIKKNVIQCSWLKNQIISSNDFHPFSKTANFIFGGFNCHIAHHIFPNISHVYYEKLNSIIYAVFLEHGIQPNRTSYFGGIRSHLIHLRMFGLNKES